MVHPPRLGRPWVASLVLLVTMAGVLVVPVGVHASDWPTEGHDLARSGSLPEGPRPVSEWTADIQATEPVLILGERVVTGATIPRDELIYALGREDGHTLWATKGAGARPPPATDGTRLFAQTYDGGFKVAAFNLTDGSRVWEFREQAYDQSGSFVVINGTLYAYTKDPLWSRVWSIDAATGRLNWEANPHCRTAGTHLVEGGNITLPCGFGIVRLRTSDGAQVWNVSLDSTTHGSTGLIDAGGLLLYPDSAHRVGIGALGQDTLYALDKETGLTLNSRPLPLVSIAPPVVDGVVYLSLDHESEGVNGTQSGVLALNATTFSTVWRNTDCHRAEQIVANSESLIVGCTDPLELMRLERTSGRLVWKHDVAVWPGFALSGNNLIFNDRRGTTVSMDIATGRLPEREGYPPLGPPTPGLGTPLIMATLAAAAAFAGKRRQQKG